jgi:hypothetical protein
MKTNDTHESVSRIAGRGLVLVGLLAVALALAASSFAQSNAGTAPKAADAKAAQPSANSLTAKAARAPRGSGEGIQVHGWWTIEIRNRDGSVDRHVELENALVNDGPALLTALLTGTSVAGSWALAVSGDPGPCGSGFACWIVMPGSSVTGFGGGSTLGCTNTLGALNPQPYCYSTLGLSLTGAPTPDMYFSSFVLSGQAYVTNTTTITTLDSLLATCGAQGLATFSPSTCNATATQLYDFTEYDFGQAGSCGGSGQALCPIPVQTGQVISVSVQYSFSSPSSGSGTPALAHPHPILRVPASTKPTASTPVTQ